jgi:hypothetical protein
MVQRFFGVQFLLFLIGGAICSAAYKQDPSFFSNYRSTRESWRIHTRSKKSTPAPKHAAAFSTQDVRAINTTVTSQIDIVPLDWDDSQAVEFFRDVQSHAAQESSPRPRIYLRYAAQLVSSFHDQNWPTLHLLFQGPCSCIRMIT